MLEYDSKSNVESDAVALFSKTVNPSKKVFQHLLYPIENWSAYDCENLLSKI